MSSVPGRIICSRCGANNFETQAACWKCGTSLASGPGPVPILSPNASGNPQPVPAYRAPSTVDPSVAFWCAIALAVFFPYVAVPVGLVFMMLDDRRKLELGRLTLIAGIVCTIIQIIFTWMVVQSLMVVAYQQVPALLRNSRQPGLTDNVGDGGLRGIPGLPGASMPQAAPPPLSTQPDVPFPDPPAPR